MDIKKALVVDDSKLAHLTLRKLLVERSLEVDWVGSGEECIKYLENKTPDIIFMDVMMPGMDGFETTRAITGQSETRSLAIVMCSANATDEDKRDAKDSGAVGFLSKPYTIDQLDVILDNVSKGTSAITLGAAEPAAPAPKIVEKEPVTSIPTQPAVAVVPESEPVQPAVAAPEPAARVADGAVPAPAAGKTVAAPAAAAMSPAEVEQIAERVAWGAAEKTARDIVQELVPNMTREIAMQAARGIAEDLGRRAAHAAVRAAQEAAKQVATEIARGTAEKTARTAAHESARAVAEQAAREVSEGVAQRNIARGLEMNRDEVVSEIESQVDKKTREMMGLYTDTPEFKRHVIQMVRSGIQPIIETIAHEAADKSVQSAVDDLKPEAASGSGVALAVGGVALLLSLIALANAFLKFF